MVMRGTGPQRQASPPTRSREGLAVDTKAPTYRCRLVALLIWVRLISSSMSRMRSRIPGMVEQEARRKQRGVEELFTLVRAAKQAHPFEHTQK